MSRKKSKYMVTGHGEIPIETGEKVVLSDGTEFVGVTDAEAEKAEYVICAPWEGPHYFLDDVQGTCVGCLRPVRFRPTAPKKPPKLCMACHALKEREQ